MEAVCLKCLAHDPRARYGSADDLLADLNRYLTGQLVHARPVGPVRRLLNWTRRKPLVAALSGTLLVSVVMAFAVVTWQWRLADRNRQEADRNFQLAHHELREIQSILYEGGKYDAQVYQPLRGELMQALVEYYETLHENAPDDPELRADMADALYHKGFLAEVAGDLVEAEKCYLRSLILWEDLVREVPEASEHRYYLAKVHEHMANISRRQHRPCEELLHREQSFAIRKALVEQFPDDLGFQNELAHSYRYLGECHLNRKNGERALKLISASYELGRHLLEETPESLEIRERQSKVCYKLAQIHQQRKQPETALHYCEEAGRILQSLAAEQPEEFDLIDLGGRISYVAARIHLDRGDLDHALQSCEETQRQFQRLLQDDPANAAGYQISLQMASARLKSVKGKKDRALRDLDQSLLP